MSDEELHPTEQAQLTRWMHDKARRMAVAQLISEHQMDYEIYRHAFLEKLREEHNWQDGRPAANKNRTAYA